VAAEVALLEERHGAAEVRVWVRVRVRVKG